MFANKMTVYQYLDIRYKNKDGLYQIKIAVCKDRKTDFINTKIFCSSAEWTLLQSKKVPKKLVDKKNRILEGEGKVVHILHSLTSYDFKKLKSIYEATTLPSLPDPVLFMMRADIFSYFDSKIEELTIKEAWGSRLNYIDCKSFYKKYLEVTYCEFSQITVLKLIEIQKKAERVMSKSNIYRQARMLRHIFNNAIADGVIDRKIYPFHKRGYLIPQTRKSKKAITSGSINELFTYKPRCDDERMAIDYFVFSFFGNGMNMKDIAYLRYKNIYGNIIRFEREKTKNTTIDSPIITIAITEEMWEVIKRQGNIQNTPDDLIFPIIKDDKNTYQHFVDYRNHNRVVNEWLEKICGDLGLPKITHGMSRHTFATALKMQGVSTEYIQEALGHTSLTTTEHYLSSFTNDIVISHVSKLKNFVKGK